MTHETLPADLLEKVTELLKNKRKIEAVKVVRETTGWGLKQSKDAVDSLVKVLGV
jgi:ribosomal protein L7/L12